MKMETGMVLLWAIVAALFSQNLLVPVMSADNFEDQKNYFHIPPAVSFTPPAHGSGGGHATPTPAHGGAPPANCGNPPSGGQQHPTPSPPRSGGSGGGYYRPPPISTPTISPPTAPIIIPGTPSAPGITVPSPPFPFDPNSPPFNCTYWRNHPTLIWSLVGWWGTVGNAFGVSSMPGIGAHMNLLEALSNTRTDGFGELYREGTAALLNAMAHTRFPYTTTQVRDSFAAALSSNKAAVAQAQLFRMANDGQIKPRA